MGAETLVCLLVDQMKLDCGEVEQGELAEQAVLDALLTSTVALTLIVSVCFLNQPCRKPCILSLVTIFGVLANVQYGAEQGYIEPSRVK